MLWGWHSVVLLSVFKKVRTDLFGGVASVSDSAGAAVGIAPCPSRKTTRLAERRSQGGS
jgi:hypothetical protein